MLYGLGAALGRRGGEDLGLVYLQLALYLAPNQPLALLSLADLYEQVKNPSSRSGSTSACRRTRRCAATPRSSSRSISTLDRTDEAKQRLQKLIAEHPDDIEAIMALGNILRGRKEFAECAEVYSKGIAHDRQAGEAELADLLLPRHLQRALQAVGEGREPT